jgi:hypothetical protein
MEKAGFDVVFETATFPMELFILMGTDYRGNDILGQQCHETRLKTEQTFGEKAFDFYKHLYDNYKWGRELVFVGQKRT